ncbi:Glycoside hydrolase family 3 [Macrophomina phaseolina MS6]|uniref:xylan 1,4-beta-xylosidase n=1 Tax=Macrophomina phaseolina (strain MS6) TaxID=1126212 RepID=K2SFM1_MACPH|nr:Glycoside hydrolase family 3 [Macrophomina phaseolina MS6]
MTVADLVLQLHLMFGDNIVGPRSQNELYDLAMRAAPDAAVGNIHDWYPLNTSYYNGMQQLVAKKARLHVPFLHFGECLHGVGSYKQSMFPQSIGLSASFDADLVYRVGRAIGTEARSIGVHACLSPVLDLSGKEPRFGRLQEAWGEDKVLTSIMGVAYASGLSKNGSWSDPDAVAPVMKHFAAYGAPQSGLNAAPWIGHGNREILEELLMPFKAVVNLGGVRGVMMAYNELDGIPAHVSPLLYQALEDWEFDGFVMGDDLGVSMLEGRHQVSTGPADTLTQWFNAGGMIQFYDYSLDDFLNTTAGLVSNGSVPLSTLQAHIKRILGVKYDLGLFSDSLISDSIDPQAITASHVPLTREAAHKSIVLLDNHNSTLPLKPADQGIQKLALIGPFIDTLNCGDYSGTFGAFPVANSSTLLQAVLAHTASLEYPVELITAWGANQWLYNQQVPIAGYHLSPPNSSNSSGGGEGLLATYYADTNFTTPLVRTIETPFLDWGLYPPSGLPSNNFSAIWEGIITVPSTLTEAVEGYLGVAVYANTTATLYIDSQPLVTSPLTTSGNFLSNIQSRTWAAVNSTAAPPGSAPFTFHPGARHRIRITYQAYNLYQKIENQNSLNAQILLFWNLVDRRQQQQQHPANSPPAALAQAISAAHAADAIILHLGSGWSSDGEGGDRASLSLSPNQSALADAVFGAAASANKPVVLVLTGGRPLAIPEYYNRSSAVLHTFFPGQQGGSAVADVLYTARAVTYLDEENTPAYPFGYGLSYSNFSAGGLTASVVRNGSVVADGPAATFAAGDYLRFGVPVSNEGPVPGSYVVQVYLLQRVSQITQPAKQLVAFSRLYLEVGEERTVDLEVEVDRYLRILDRKMEWRVESGEYTFAVLSDGGVTAEQAGNVTMRCTE